MTSVPANVPAHSGASPTRDPAFSLQDFGALVSSALDSFLPPKNGQSTRQYASDTFKKLKGALRRRKDQQDASKDALRTRPPLLSETRHLTSSSVPVLSEIEPSRLKRVHASTSLANLRVYEDGRFDSNMSYIATPASPGEPYGSGIFRLPTNVPSWSRHDLRNHANEHAFPEIPRDAQNSRSFLSLKPLIIPSLTKKSSRLLFSSGSPPSSLSEQITSPRNVGSPQDDSGVMFSFFDDSGYADDALPAYKVVREKSRPGLRSLFSSSTLNSELRSQSRYNISARKWEDKALPPPPTEGQPSTQIHQADRTSRTFTGRNEAQRQEMGDKHAVASLFYTSPSHRKAPRRPIHDRLSAHIGKLHGDSRRPPPYPSPTSPLPPTPDLLPVGLPAVSPANSDHYHATDGDASRRSNEGSERSVDSMEILSWRMPVLEQRISKNSTSSAGHAHACGRPSRGSIRERLGLGPRLHLHVPLPTQDVSQPHPYAKSRSASLSPYKHNKTFSCLTVRPVPGKVSSSPKRSVSRLASASLVSLRSITTITAPSKDIYDEDADSDRRDALGVDRAFTPEDDPFAAIAPSPVSPLFYTHIPIKNTKLRSFMPLGNNSTVSVGKAVPETPMSAPATLTSFQSHCDLRSTSSSPVLTASSSIEISMQPPLINEARVASPSSVNSGLPPSLVEALRQTPSSPHVSDYLNIPRHNLSHVLAQTRKVQGARKASSKSKLNGNGEGNSHHVVGHTDSRPNSPFPMIFLKSVAAKASSAALKKNKRESILSSQSEMTEERSNKGEPVAAEAEAETTPQSYTSELLVECPIQGLVCEPLGANDADAFGEACRAEVKRDIMSPTAWFLDEDCTRDTEAANNNIDSSTRGPEPGEGEAHADALMKETVGEEGIDQPAPPQLFRESLHKAYPETDSETDTENECGPSDSRSWPLPPPRTVVVNEENGESWHTVEPIVEVSATVFPS
ncbi:hypothetical protein DFH11DRAFT_1722249 [Phellopilus nigrolimitatus]|nr:hypothetical protein DFH11DRAFT_1722249 [Phellopilus nigrolimitatus]